MDIVDLDEDIDSSEDTFRASRRNAGMDIVNLDEDIDWSEGWSEAANHKLDTLLQLFPDGDFKYLKSKSLELASNDSAFENFVNDALTLQIVPASTPHDASSQTPSTRAVFDVERFIEAYPDPFVYFDNLERTESNQRIIVEILKDRFREVKTSYIEHVVVEQNYRLIRSAEALINPPAEYVRIVPREDAAINIPSRIDVIVQKELLLLDHRQEVEEFLKLQEEIKKTAIEEGQVFECECCCADDILPNEVIVCTEGHLFCRQCIKQNTELRIGNGLTTFPCPLMGGCTLEGTIRLRDIQEVINANVYQKLVARISEEEVKKADIVGIEYCQRCEYGAIPDETIIIFRCANCGFELCRRCNRESHVPRKCGETPEEDAQKQQRKKNEELQTTQVLRRCGNCKKPYIKIDGCDKVICTCGTANCYKCGSFGIDYPHLNSCPGRYPPT